MESGGSTAFGPCDSSSLCCFASNAPPTARQFVNTLIARHIGHPLNMQLYVKKSQCDSMRRSCRKTNVNGAQKRRIVRDPSGTFITISFAYQIQLLRLFFQTKTVFVKILTFHALVDRFQLGSVQNCLNIGSREVLRLASDPFKVDVIIQRQVRAESFQNLQAIRLLKSDAFFNRAV